VGVAVEALWTNPSDSEPTTEKSGVGLESAPAVVAPESPGAAETDGQERKSRAAPGAKGRRRSGGISDHPPISCICPTYGRPHLLEEAVYSFLRQDYPGRKELVVLNDLDQQTLSFDHPEVTVINLTRRFRTLGEKYNAAIAVASHELLFPWEDDDIYLPNRLSYSVEHFDPRSGFFKLGLAWVWNDGQISGPESNLFHAQSCWSREFFQGVGGYASMGLGHDVEMEARLEAARPGSTSTFAARPEDLFYIYRWRGTASYHGSAFTEDEHQAVGEFVHQELGSGRLPVGEISLTPRWHSDYVALIRDKLGRQRTPAPVDRRRSPGHARTVSRRVGGRPVTV
jgi:hypothetical protein